MEVKKRDYKKEYAKYGKGGKAKKYRAALNRINRRKGNYGNGDGLDEAHVGSSDKTDFSPNLRIEQTIGLSEDAVGKSMRS